MSFFARVGTQLNSALVINGLEITLGFAAGTPIVNYGVQEAVAYYDQNVEVPAFEMPEARNVLYTGGSALLFCLGLFGIKGVPRGAQPLLREQILDRIESRHPEGSFVYSFVEGGVALGLSQYYREAYPDVVYHSKAVGDITWAWPRIIAAEMGLNMLFYPLFGAAMGYDPLNMIVPALITTAAAELGLAGVSFHWGSDDTKQTALALIRGGTFFALNSFSSLSASGATSEWTAIGIQAGVGLAISMGALALVARSENQPSDVVAESVD